MGLLGLSTSDYLPDRMFAVFDQDDDGLLSFEDYLKSLSIMLKGSEVRVSQLGREIRISFHSLVA